MKPRHLGLALLAVCLAATGLWLYCNAHLPTLRRGFVPWMERLGRWRDGIEQVQKAVKSRTPSGEDAAGVEPLRNWAWDGLERIAYVSYDVRKPTHEVSAGVERTSGLVYFTVGGFRRDGARMETAAVATVEIDGNAVRARLERVLLEKWQASPRFRNATAEAGLGAPRRDPKQGRTNRLIAGIWPGSGVAVLDVENDGDEDLFVGDGVRSILYENDGAGCFRDVTEQAGLAASPSEGVAATGVAAGDVDGDGLPDLVVTDSFGPIRLFRNEGGRRFVEATASSGLRAIGNTRSAAFADVDRDGDLDLFVCVTGDYYRQMPDPPYDAEDAGANLLFVNDGAGRFREESRAWNVGDSKRWSLSALFADYDGDGHSDLVVTNDFGLKNLHHNDSGRRFEDVTRRAGVEDRAYGMSGALADFDGDGSLDLYTTGCYTQWAFLHDYPSLPIPFPGRLFLPTAVSWMKKMTRGNSLLIQKPDGTFEDATARSGARKAGWNWSVVAADLDNDGWTDLYATNGMWGDGRERDRELEFWWETLAYWNEYVALRRTFDRKGAGISGIEQDRWFRNRGEGGSADPLFEEHAFVEGLDLESNGRAVVAFDANRDGALDLYVRSVGAPEALFLGSRRGDEHFLRLRLRGSRGRDNSDGIGARVVATLPGGRRIVLENGNASGYLATGSPVVHVGLGAATRVEDLVVRWPSGAVQRLGPVSEIDRTWTVDGDRGLLPLP